MSSDFSLNVDQLSKTYHLYDAPVDRLKQMLSRGKRQYFQEFQALKSLSFSIKKGEVLGVVGRNGAGKSTLLQLICGTLTPSTGHVHIQGRIAALLELGAGFNPQFTGRENIFLSASIMGVSRKEIDQKLDDIIEFSGVGGFIDQPVSTYSSGMYVRLAFSVATSVEPDILIIDEALSVGDGDFARRSFERIMSMKERGATILFCSHSLYQIEVLCSKAIWIEKGELIKEGKPAAVLADYQAFLDCLNVNPDAKPTDIEKRERQAQELSAPEDVIKAPVGQSARIVRIDSSTGGQSGDVLNVISGQSDVTIDIQFKSTLQEEVPQVAIAIHSASGQLISSCAAWISGQAPSIDDHGMGNIQVSFPKLPLLKGTYYVGVLLFCERGLFLHDEADPALTLHVTQEGQERGVVVLPHVWSCPQTSKLLKDDAIVKDRKPSERWQVREASATKDFESIKRLFQDTFKQPLHEEIWHWKYKYAKSPGYVVSEGDEVVGFCGGAPRRGMVKGQLAMLAQLGDVMVDKRQRGVLTKTGPFYRSVYGFLTEKIGLDREFSFGFGFPNRRHLRVGERQNLYKATDRILEAKWPAKKSQCQLVAWTGESGLGDKVDVLWQQMKPYLGSYLVGVRDQDWMRFRFLEKPMDSYQVWFVLGSERPQEYIGLIVLKDHPEADHMELLDFICARKNSGKVLDAARHQAFQTGRQSVFSWLSGNVYSWLETDDSTVETTEVFVPGNALDEPEHLAKSKGNWWLMGGDSDFR
ncbi:GNAT family N-acetyltransferase [Marinomonas gallaica]|uniref:GNAT family N-acetyltransferase n=1 Tax=Marinomonas gallaica TaxID=1806667 RepID=UPI00082A6ABB|nr:GNAT family N-acetyltransferase [Marinomonas gallaica]